MPLSTMRCVCRKIFKTFKFRADCKQGRFVNLDEQGEVVNADALTRQTHNVLQHVESILTDLDASLQDIVKLVIYFVGDDSDERLILDTIATYLDSNTRPVVSTICLPELCYPGMRIELEAVAVDPSYRSDSNPKYIRSRTLAALHEQYSHVVLCNDLIFTGDISAVQANGSLPAKGDLIEQTRLMMMSLKHALALAEVTFESVLKLNVYYQGDGTAATWTEPATIRAACFPEPGPAATGIAVTGFARAGLMTKIAVTAANTSIDQVPEVQGVQYSWPEGHWNWTTALPYKHGNRFGHLIHVGGQVALDVDGKVLYPDDIVRQTRVALENIKTILVDLGAGMDDVVKVTAFYQGEASADALHENLKIRSNAFNTPGPATSGIPVPHLVYEKMLIEIEVIAIAS